MSQFTYSISHLLESSPQLNVTKAIFNTMNNINNREISTNTYVWEINILVETGLGNCDRRQRKNTLSYYY